MLKLSLRTMLAVLAAVLPALAHAADVTGELTGDTVWYASASPYRMIGDVTIPPGITLTIEPGVTVTTTSTDNQLSYDTTRVELIVRGSLKVGVTAAGPTTRASRSSLEVRALSARGAASSSRRARAGTSSRTPTWPTRPTASRPRRPPG